MVGSFQTQITLVSSPSLNVAEQSSLFLEIWKRTDGLVYYENKNSLMNLVVLMYSSHRIMAVKTDTVKKCLKYVRRTSLFLLIAK